MPISHANVLFGLDCASAPVRGSVPAENLLLKLNPALLPESEPAAIIIAAEAPILSDATISYQTLVHLRQPRASSLVFLTSAGETLAMALLAASLTLDGAEAGAFVLAYILESVSPAPVGARDYEAFAFLIHRVPPPDCAVLVAELKEGTSKSFAREVLSAAALQRIVEHARAARPLRQTTLLIGRAPGLDGEQKCHLLRLHEKEM
ncbi:hypothetical protein CfE428DRAFT_1313 [Chthoniobacter flavus Ellin428]|uniref:Uncharacterized protein n=1 Tax=Chthoniobacter flavus Ellin428 TaxID=497964 RepID=B4CXM2_9BACT|nr:hypothetical protein [Chthoniobacter flavus]EDY21020.1 hypothetical protein CfE428DRAFT_1313 [Chthoniobacter flavus Ellin428]TCO88745.1 hypothetical protein EV701_116117 [Chthoniobacter flavus]